MTRRNRAGRRGRLLVVTANPPVGVPRQPRGIDVRGPVGLIERRTDAAVAHASLVDARAVATAAG